LTNDEDIFSEDYGKGKKKPEPESKPNIEETPKDESKPEVKKEEKKPRPELIKPTVGRAKVVGISVIGVIIAVIAIMATGVIQLGEPEFFDASGCEYGVKSDFMSQRCMTLAEYDLSIAMPTEPEPETDEPFKEVSSPSNQENLPVKSGIAGYYMVSSCCDWYGDFVNIDKAPKKINKAGNTKVDFICYEDEHLKTNTYFGTFKNNLDPVLIVDVFINGKKVQSKTTDSGSALILEGFCN